MLHWFAFVPYAPNVDAECLDIVFVYFLVIYYVICLFSVINYFVIVVVQQ